MIRYKLRLILAVGLLFAFLPLKYIRAQTHTVKGTVISTDDGKPLPGVNVVVEGTSHGISTDLNGKYQISLSPNERVLVFTFIGFKKKEVTVEDRSTINVKMVPTTQSLDQLVVTGYGTENRQELTTSISHVDAEDLETQSVTSFSEALAGKSPGVRVQQTSGSPGGGISIQVRGQGSIQADNNPLYVVDGVPLSSAGQSGIGASNQQAAINPLASISTDDIQSIDVLKGSSATSIYGSRGANGVIVITTKKGTAGESQINFKATTGWQQNARKMPIMSKQEYVQEQMFSRNIGWEQQAEGNSRDDPNSVRPDNFKIPQDFNDPSQLAYTDWQDALYRDAAPEQKYVLSASGGSEDIQYYVSGHYSDIDGLVVNSGFKDYGFRANITGDISDHIQVGINIAPSYSTRNQANQSGLSYYGGGVASAFNNSPFQPVQNADGSYSYDYTFNYPDGTSQIQKSYRNPVAAAEGIQRSLDHFNTIGNAFVKIDFLDRFSLKSNLSGDFNFYNKNKFNPSTVADNSRPPVVPSGYSYSARDIRWDNRNLLTYDDTFSDKHNLNVLFGFEEQKSNSLNSRVNAQGFPNDRVPTLNVGQVNGGYSNRSAWTLLSALARVKYNYDQKYFVKATIRRDGSSRFGENNKWGSFPSASVGWRIGQEDFMNNISSVSQLKLRASYGVTGNNGIGDYAPIGQVKQSDIILGSPASIINGLYQSSLSNPDLTWEKQKEFDLGLDLGLFESRINFTADFYNRINSDLLLNVNLPLATGYSSTTRNLGKVRNRGLELALNTINIQNKNFRWSTGFNLSLNRNKVLDLEGQRILKQDYEFFNPPFFLTTQGLPVGSYYGYVFEGIYKDQAEFNNHAHLAKETALKAPGSAKFKDLNGDGEITPDGDKKVLGNNYPDFIYGISSNLNYKGLSFSFQLQGERGADQINLLKHTLYRRLGEDFTDYWRSPENPGDGKTPAPGGGTGNIRNQPSSYYVEDASFLRISSVNLGYTLPQHLLDEIGSLRTVRVFFNVHNVYTFTSYDGYNPQAKSRSGYNQTLRPGIDYGTYPLARTFSMGIDVGL